MGAVTNFISGGKQQKAQNQMDQATGSFESLELPDIADMRIKLEGLVQQGVLTPEMAEAAMADPSLFAEIENDPALKNAQLNALTGLQEVASEGGITAKDRSQLEAIKSDIGTQEKGAREAILQNARERGVSGSGLELMAQLQAQQGAATRGAQQGFDVAAQAQDRALAALQQAGTLGGSIRGQDYDEQAQAAAAQDAINKFNTSNLQTVGLTNTAAKNQAQQQNLSEKQRIADQSVALRNQQEMHNKALIQQDFENRYKKAGGTAGAYQAAAQQSSNQARDNLGFVGGLAQAGGTAISDERAKDEIRDFDPSEFLDAITGYKYKYKDKKKNGEGDHAGVMAQDLEKTSVGKSMVEDTKDGKVVDYGKGFGTILACLADMHDRVKKVEGK
jgi:hypothetical protein